MTARGVAGGEPLGGPARRSFGLGYHPDLPDLRDITIDHDFEQTDPGRVLALAQKAQGKPSMILSQGKELPKRVHLGDTGLLPPVEDQGQIGSCTANAVIGLVEYLFRSAMNGREHLDLSRMFLYKTTRRLLGWTGDTGAYIRTTIKSMVLFGVPPEADWPYEAERLDVEPEAYHYAYGQSFKGLMYARMDGYGDLPDGYRSRGEYTLDLVRRTLTDGFPVAFGFPVYRSIGEMDSSFVIPVPRPSDKLEGGHAVLAVGYDDRVQVPGQRPGAIIIRNSWSADWGDQGYGFLPYAYVLEEWAVDWWTIFKNGSVNLGQFE